MTIRKAPCGDGFCIVCVFDDDDEPIATACFTNDLNAKMAVQLLETVLTELDVAKEIKK